MQNIPRYGKIKKPELTKNGYQNPFTIKCLLGG